MKPPAAPFLDAHETHTGVVIVAGDRAFKAKKPVHTDFLDFRTVEQREQACTREVELNSRLSPDSYFGVAHLQMPTGEPPEPVIVMRRYHDEDRLASMVRRGLPAEHVLDSIAEVMARFHEKAHRGRAVTEQGRPGAVAGRWNDNFAALAAHAGTVVAADALQHVETLVAEYLAGRACLFARRIEQQCIVDGHADLLADDIFWVDNRPVLLDCLEFSDELRYLDRIDDIAFLAMDLEFLGRPDLGEYLLDRYTAYAGDDAPPSLRDFYTAYRAVVRAKTDCVQLTQGKAGAAEAAANHLAMATRHLERGAIRLALVGGGPGTGKSTLARELAKQPGTRMFSTDDLRRELLDAKRISGEAGTLNTGLYEPGKVAAVYQEMMHRASLALADGYSVVLDGTWRDPALRGQAQTLAADKHAALVQIRCVLPPDVAAERISNRPKGNSDATPEIAAALAAQDFAWDSAHRIDTSQPVDQSARAAGRLWRTAPVAGGRRPCE